MASVFLKRHIGSISMGAFLPNAISAFLSIIMFGYRAKTNVVGRCAERSYTSRLHIPYKPATIPQTRMFSVFASSIELTAVYPAAIFDYLLKNYSPSNPNRFFQTDRFSSWPFLFSSRRVLPGAPVQIRGFAASGYRRPFGHGGDPQKFGA